MRYVVPAVETAGLILRHLAIHGGKRATLTSIATAVDRNTASVMRILKTLEMQGIVHYDEHSRHYALGTYLFVLGSRAAEQIDFLAAALPLLRPAAETTGFTCMLVQRQGAESLMYVAKEEPAKPMRLSASVGQRFRLTAGSHGKAFLAHMPEDEARSIVEQLGLPRFTDKSITSWNAYLAELRRVRKAGYAVSMEEHFTGIFGVAAPIFSGAHVPLVLSAIGISAEISDDAAHELGRVVRELADRMSSRLSGQPIPIV